MRSKLIVLLVGCVLFFGSPYAGATEAVPVLVPASTTGTVITPAPPPSTAAVPWKPMPWQGVLVLASWDVSGGKLVKGPAVSAGWAGYMQLPIVNFSLVYGGALGHSTTTVTTEVRGYVGVGWGGDSKMEPSVQAGVCPALLVVQGAEVQAPRFSFCVGGALPIL